MIRIAGVALGGFYFSFIEKKKLNGFVLVVLW